MTRHDGESVSLAGTRVARLQRFDWGDEVATIITAESLSTWPLYQCDFAFSWSTQFANVEYGYAQ